MKINEMSICARRNTERPVIPLADFSEKERSAALYADLSLSFNKFWLIKANGSGSAVLDQYCDVLMKFLLVASSHNMIDRFLITQEEIKQMQEKWQSKSFNSLYLIINQQLYNAYFKHQTSALLHAWRMVLKLGVRDLGYSAAEIEKRYFEIFQ
ncbi:hypothetical protein LFYK43_20470 [Ligilactobacillus salitolerans]|uniref:dUTPase n=1 Tax=Ligilactobacillus salitolerans TaxID=1808352 RepID=A0A401IVP6_9LACO|nr:hypothetical protein [Ligilactobacillus salitolerans]GBG95588.1 hypothetical protein LFYK43_20470 [Ligilactobacillus salitolerans]